ncbi:MAG: M23 family metallopeptidase [Pseudomonadota bacterium]
MTTHIVRAPTFFKATSWACVFLLGLGFTWIATAQDGTAGRCVDLSGNPMEGGLIWGQVDPGASVTLDGEALDLLPDGRFVAGFHRDAQAVSELVVNGTCRQQVDVQQRDYRISRIEGVPQRTVTPSEEHLDRIRRERQLVSKAKARRIKNPVWLMQIDAAFEWPVKGRISGVYGSQRIYNGTPGSPHYGIDIAVPTGTPVYAPAAGQVTLAQTDLFYSGGTIILDHGYALSSSFLHLSALDVEVGTIVQKGDLLGRVGASGRATGPHLDWRMSWRNCRVDPQLLVDDMPPQISD